jgi:hypothetical protein
VSSSSEAHHQRRLCCVVSNANGEDPAGSAAPFAVYLLVEVAPPWKGEVSESRRFPEGLKETVEGARSVGSLDKFTGLMPDPEYSREGHIRVILFRKPPTPLFAAYQKEEYVVPDGAVVPLVEALITDREGLSRFARYRQEDAPHIRDILVCTHGSRDACCGKFGYPLYEELRHRYAPESEGRLRVWRTSHIGGHRFAPNLLDLAEGRYWSRMGSEALQNLVLRNAPASNLRPFYRGWAGLGSNFEQLVEREVFASEGWGWTKYPKVGKVLETNENRAEIRIEYQSAEGVSRAYEATVEAAASVTTLMNSGAGPLEKAQQYRVSRLEKVFPEGKDLEH